jgi:hypothetical protein
MTEPENRKKRRSSCNQKNWPNGAQLVISVSMQFETGGQPEGAEVLSATLRFLKASRTFLQKAGTVMVEMKGFTACWICGKNMISK